MDDSPAVFSIDRALRVGWEGFRPNAASLAPLAGAMVAVGAAFRWLAFQAEALALAVLFDVMGLVLSSMLLLLLAFAALAIVDGRPLDFPAYLASGLFRTQAVASIIFWVTTLLGILLLLIPGIFIVLTYCLYTFVIADRPTSPLRSLLESFGAHPGQEMGGAGIGSDVAGHQRARSCSVADRRDRDRSRQRDRRRLHLPALPGFVLTSLRPRFLAVRNGWPSRRYDRDAAAGLSFEGGGRW